MCECSQIPSRSGRRTLPSCLTGRLIRLCCSILLLVSVINNKSSLFVYAHPTIAGSPTPQVAMSQQKNTIHAIESNKLTTPKKLHPSSMFILRRKNQHKPITAVQPQNHQSQTVFTAVQQNDHVSINDNISNFKLDLLHRIQIASYFALWYALNVIFNSTYRQNYTHSHARIQF